MHHALYMLELVLTPFAQILYPLTELEKICTSPSEPGSPKTISSMYERNGN